MLSALYVLSFVDRMILALLVSPLKASLGVSDVQLGLLFGPAFGIFYAALGLPLARLADRGNRRRLIVAGVLLWGAATVASGFAGTFSLLVMLRVGLAIGEAALTPAAYSMIGDLFPPQRRTLAASVYSGIGNGGAFASFILGSMVIHALGGAAGMSAGFQSWQLVFFAVGIPTIAVGLIFALTTREPERIASSRAAAPSVAEVVAHVRSNAALYIGLFGGAGLLQAIGYSWTAWGPELARRNYALPIDRAGLAFGIAGVLAAIAGTVLFPLWSRRLAATGRPSALALMSMVGVLGGAVFAVCAVGQATPVPFFVLATLSMFCVIGGANNVLVGMQTLAPPRMRATLVAGVLLSITVLGLCIGPPLSAAISAGISSAGDALGTGLAAVAVLIALPSLALFAWSGRGMSTSVRDSSSTEPLQTDQRGTSP